MSLSSQVDTRPLLTMYCGVDNHPHMAYMCAHQVPGGPKKKKEFIYIFFFLLKKILFFFFFNEICINTAALKQAIHPHPAPADVFNFLWSSQDLFSDWKKIRKKCERSIFDLRAARHYKKRRGESEACCALCSRGSVLLSRETSEHR